MSDIEKCPGMIDKDGNWHPSIVHEYDPSRELILVPAGSSVYPTIEQQETLWQIVQEVAERDSTYAGDVGFDDVTDGYYCPFLYCDGAWTIADRAQGKPFQHKPECIVTKARQLMEWHKAQPKIEVKIDFTGSFAGNALVNAMDEHPVDVVEILREQRNDGEVPHA